MPAAAGSAFCDSQVLAAHSGGGSGGSTGVGSGGGGGGCGGGHEHSAPGPLAAAYNALAAAAGLLDADIAAGWAPPEGIIRQHVQVTPLARYINSDLDSCNGGVREKGSCSMGAPNC